MARDRDRQHLVQTRVSAETHKAIKKAASSEDEDVGSWLRRLVVRELRELHVVQAWVMAAGAPRDSGLGVADPRPEDAFFLRPRRLRENFEREFIVLKNPTMTLAPFELQARRHLWGRIESRAAWVFLRNGFSPMECVELLPARDLVLLTLRRVEGAARS